MAQLGLVRPLIVALSYGKSSPQDILAKARRDLARLVAAEAAQDTEATSDALLDLAVVLTSLKDWLKKHSSASFSATDVERYALASTALSSFRDIANSAKHRGITKYSPATSDVSTSAPSSGVGPPATGEAQANAYSRLKIIRADGSRHRAVDLARAAVQEWQDFMQQHGVT